jgi:hypothetical protein
VPLPGVLASLWETVWGDKDKASDTSQQVP